MIEGLPFYLRTSIGADGVGYTTLDQAKAALKTLISLEIERGGHVVEKKDHKWTSHQSRMAASRCGSRPNRGRS